VIPPGGHLLFHDAARFRDFAPCDPSVRRLIDEILERDAAQFRVEGGAGGLLHLVRTDARADWS
jgi:hypothetical protein